MGLITGFSYWSMKDDKAGVMGDIRYGARKYRAARTSIPTLNPKRDTESLSDGTFFLVTQGRAWYGK